MPIKTEDEQLQHQAKKCVHFNGLQNKECKAGVDYKSLPERKWGSFICFGESEGCQKFQATGMEKAKADRDLVMNHFKDAMIARKAITDHEKGKRGVHGKINCPVCNGVETLHYSIAGYNGHIHAKCKTENCVAWME